MFENIATACGQAPWIFGAFFFCMGACVGSFLNVCIYRIPRGKSIVSPPSSCACGRRIAWYDNIPILSWFVLRGKARCCGRRFSFRYALVEIMTALIYLYLWQSFPWKAALALMFFVSLLIVASFIDIDTMELPDVLTVGGILAGVVISAAAPQIHSGAYVQGEPLASSIRSLILSCGGAAFGAGVLYLTRLLAECVFGREAMGEGDVVLTACIGAFCGWQGAVFAIFGGSVIGALVLLPIMAFFKIFGGKKRFETEVPFGPWLSLGAAAYAMFLSPYVDRYFSAVAEALF